MNAKKQPRISVVVVETDYNDRVPGMTPGGMYPLPKFGQAVQEARAAFVEAAKKERYFWPAK